MSATTTGTTTYAVDPAHSSVEFSVKHLGIASVKGSFGRFEGTLELGEDLAASRARGTVEVDSVDTNEPQRDAHLRSPDFFDAAVHPQISFASTEITPRGDDEFDITGDLNMHGVTRPITLHAEITGRETDPWGNERVGLEVTGSLDRSEYGMKFNQVLGSGNVLVSDKVKIQLEISAVKQSA